MDEGKLYLFWIYNKDFSPYSKGTPNLHTLYWRMLFSEENLRDVVYKLNGQAEVFYRRSSIPQEDIIRHPANEPIKNKDVHTEKKTSLFSYDLIKDRRYTIDKIQFHVPITMNYKARGENYLNRKVLQKLRETDEYCVIGIDRGERNLLYLSVINQNGEIVKQMSLNEIITYDKENHMHTKDYHELLDQREKENKAARQNWKTISTIKELKEGYLSQVIHVITELMIEYNAVVVLEDLNFGFMRSRQKFEKQVYQKFEKMLIDKLNYLADKKLSPESAGGLLRAYQLTNQFESFQKLGKQSGFLFYVQAWNTSRIDPTTGFVNLFYTKYRSVEETRNFIKGFVRISFNAAEGYFEFAFDYSNFTYKAEGSRTKWVVCSQGNRIERFRNAEKNNEWDARTINLTEQWKELFTKHGIQYEPNDFRASILEVDTKAFYESFMRLFALTVQMRNSDQKQDLIISPVKNSRGEFFTTSEKDEKKPIDADANGAYNIAKKGLWIIEQVKASSAEEVDKVKISISNKDWLQYAQSHTI